MPNSVRIEAVATFREELCGNLRRLPAEVEKAVQDGVTPKISPLKKVVFEIAFGPQVVHHVPLHPAQGSVGVETDAVFQADVNFVFHDEDRKGLESSLAVQGSGNYFVVDPNRNVKNEIPAGRFAGQGQVQVQVGYFFPITIAGQKFTFSTFLQFAGGATYQYDPAKRSPQLSSSLVGATGLGFSYA